MLVWIRVGMVVNVAVCMVWGVVVGVVVGSIPKEVDLGIVVVGAWIHLRTVVWKKWRAERRSSELS